MTTDDARQGDREVAQLVRQLRLMEDEVGALRRRLARSPAQSSDRVADLEQRVEQLQATLESTSVHNERLVRTLKDARDQIVALKFEVDRLAQPPSGFGTVVEVIDPGTVDVLTGGRKMRVAVSPAIGDDELSPGREVLLNEAMNVVQARGFESSRSMGRPIGLRLAAAWSARSAVHVQMFGLLARSCSQSSSASVALRLAWMTTAWPAAESRSHRRRPTRRAPPVTRMRRDVVMGLSWVG